MRFRASLLLWLALAWLSPAEAQSPPGFSTYQGSGQTPLSDPFYIFPYSTFGFNPPFVDTTGYTPVSCTLVGGQSTAVIVAPGQSNASNIVDSAYTVTQSLSHHLNIYDGNCYASKGVLLGASGSGASVSNILARLEDKLIVDAHYARVIIVPMEVNNTSVADWANPQNAPYIYNSIAVVARRLAAQGLTATHIVWMQGETDTALGTSQAAYTAGLNTIIAGFRNAGITAPFLVNEETWNVGVTSATVQAAQLAASGTNVFQGANLDSINGTGRQAGSTHFNATGADTGAGLMEAKIILH